METEQSHYDFIEKLSYDDYVDVLKKNSFFQDEIPYFLLGLKKPDENNKIVCWKDDGKYNYNCKQIEVLILSDIKRLYETIGSWNIGTMFNRSRGMSYEIFELFEKCLLEKQRLKKHLLKAVKEKFQRYYELNRIKNIGAFPLLTKECKLNKKQKEHFLFGNLKFDDLPQKLQLAIKTFHKFWYKGSGNNTVAKKETIKDWIKSNSESKEELSGREIETIDTLIRPTKIKRGGNKKLRRVPPSKPA